MCHLKEPIMSGNLLTHHHDVGSWNNEPVHYQPQLVTDGDCKPDLEIVLRDTTEETEEKEHELQEIKSEYNLPDEQEKIDTPPKSVSVSQASHYAKDLGLLSLKSHVSSNENRVDLARMKVGYVRDLDHKAIEGDVAALSADMTIGPAIVNAQVLELGYEAQMGRNTGGFVRANLANMGTSVGCVDFTAGIGFDTGARAGEDGVEVQLLGCGAIVDKKEGVGITVFGTSLKFKPWSTSS